MPFTRKQDLVDDQRANPPFGSNLTYPLERYVRLHQTSGTTGKPLYWLDTTESWEWALDCWERVYRSAGVGAGDHVFLAFSFGSSSDSGPHSNPRAASDACDCRAAAWSSAAGWRHARYRRTVLCCTPPTRSASPKSPTRSASTSPPPRSAASSSRRPGGSIPSVRARIEERWPEPASSTITA